MDWESALTWFSLGMITAGLANFALIYWFMER